MKKYKFMLILSILIIISAFFVSCKDTKNEDSGKMKIAVTIAPQREFVTKITGDKAEVYVMVPAGADPETYEIGIKDMENLSDADFYFTIGVPSEENSISPVLPFDLKVIKLEDEVKNALPDLMIGEERDPHIWLSADRVIVMVEKIKDTLCEEDQENSKFYEENAKSYIDEILSAKAFAKRELDGFSDRNIIVYHPAFGYFASEHSLVMHPIEDEGKEASAKELAKIIDYAKENGINTVFYQEEAGIKQAETFAKEIGGKAVMLSPLAENYVENYTKMASLIKGALK